MSGYAAAIMVPEHHLRTQPSACCSGRVGDLEKVAWDNHATLLKHLNQNHDALRITKLALKDTEPARERTGCNPHPIVCAELVFLQLDASVGTNSRTNACNDRLLHWKRAVARADYAHYAAAVCNGAKRTPRKSARTDNRETAHG
jgi:hypothetical protein